MTCIVGIINKETNEVWIGGDSAGVNGLDISLRKDPKVFKRGEFIFGFTTSFRMGQLLMHDRNFELRKRKKNEGKHQYMVDVFIPIVRKLFKKGGFTKVLNMVEEGGFFLVGYQGKLYEVEDDFQVGEVYDNFQSIGCGSKYALGSLCSTKNISSIKKRIEIALKTAEYCSSGVKAPFIIKKLKYKK